MVQGAVATFQAEVFWKVEQRKKERQNSCGWVGMGQVARHIYWINAIINLSSAVQRLAPILLLLLQNDEIYAFESSRVIFDNAGIIVYSFNVTTKRCTTQSYLYNYSKISYHVWSEKVGFGRKDRQCE